MEAISHLDESSWKGTKKTKNDIDTVSSKDTNSLEAELAKLKEELKDQHALVQVHRHPGDLRLGLGSRSSRS